MLSFFLFCSLLLPPLSESSFGTLSIFVRDQKTGYGVFAKIEILRNSQHITSLYTDEGGHLVYTSEPGKYELYIQSKGYRPLITYFVIEEGEKINVEIHLDPIIREESIPEKKFEGIHPGRYAIYEGYIVDRITGKPVEGVKITAKNTGLQTQSDSAGYFILKIPVPRVPVVPESSPPAEILIFEKANYKTYELRDIFLIPDIYLLKILIEPGEGRIIKKKKHGLYTPEPKNGEESTPRRGDKKSNSSGSFLPPSIFSVFLDPPSSIRVGMDCYCTDCSSVTVMSLESYVKTGLDDEWISSWDHHSLRAGAVAYRSYGAFYVLNPINPNYDICSSPCCQVWEPDEAQRTRDAAIYTSGIMLEENGSIARSEYSAENNNQGCGDCYSGTGTSWPCILDVVCCGQAPNGHGRGMCQWGSERWALYEGKNWRWILEHYYNPGNMYISTPMIIASAWPEPDTLSPGETFTINIEVYNGAEDSHPLIMLGASLHQNGEYIDDPPNDRRVTVNVGYSQVWRLFEVPIGTPEGTYDLLVALWFDIDENNQITSNDLPLYLLTLESQIYISQPYVCGDANGDNDVNSADLSYLANYLFSGGPPPDPWQAGDSNGDCFLNTGDLSYLSNYLFFGGPYPNCCPTSPRVQKVSFGQ